MSKTTELFQLKGEHGRRVNIDERNHEVRFETDKHKVRIYHMQDCCESVKLVKVIGRLGNIDGVITLAEMDKRDEPPFEHEFKKNYNDSHTWTGVFIETTKGRLEFWFLGESNGYYGESVEVEIKDL
jgi:hypothetical protein